MRNHIAKLLSCFGLIFVCMGQCLAQSQQSSAGTKEADDNSKIIACQFDTVIVVLDLEVKEAKRVGF